MIDIHSHILPGIDDGAEGIAQSLQIARQMEAAGFRGVIATPHVMEGQPFLPARQILVAAEGFQQELEKTGIHLKVYPGGEHYIFPELAGWLKKGKLLTLGMTGKYILIELPSMDIPTYTEQVFFELQVQGITPILAHPERYPQLEQNPKILYEWLGKGVLYQLNLKSLTGQYGPRVQAMAVNLLGCGLVHFIGTDTHRPSSKAQPYQAELEALRQHCGASTIKTLLEDNPQAILEGRTILVQTENLPAWPREKSWSQRVLELIKSKWTKQ